MKRVVWVLIALGILWSHGQAQVAGALDTSFAHQGYRIDSLPREAAAHTVRVMLDGRIVVAGKTTDSVNIGFGVVRHLPDGSFDPSFGGNGHQFVAGPGIVNEFTSMDLQTDGKILLSAASTVSGVPRIFIQRLLVDGSLDTTFANQGTFTQTNRTSNYYGKRVFVRFDGKIYFAGDVVIGPAIHFGVGRLNANGSIDNTYGAGGIAIAQPTDQLYWMNDAAFFADGSAILIGTTDSAGTNRSCVLRLDADGTPDVTFGTNGFVYLPSTAFASVATVVEIDPAGGYFLAGTQTHNVINPSVTVCRLEANGQIDASYGQLGYVTLTDPVGVFITNDMIVDGTGKLVVVGTRTDSQADMMAARLDAAGQLDPSFGAGGIKTYPQVNTDTKASCVARQPDGKLILGGSASSAGEPANFLVARLHMDPPLNVDPGYGPITSAIAPNPNLGSFLLQWRQEETSPARFWISDVQGKFVVPMTDLGSLPAGVHERSISIRDCPAGIYFLRLIVGSDQTTEKIVVR